MSNIKQTPTPGSPQATANGCTCPVMNNHNGHGAYRDTHGVPQFWIADNCRLHGLAAQFTVELDQDKSAFVATWPGNEDEQMALTFGATAQEASDKLCTMVRNILYKEEDV